MPDSDVYIGGVEGGATKTTFTLMKADGTVVCQVTGPNTNQWQIGLRECSRRVNALATEVKTKAGLDVETKFHAMGLSMSGGDSEQSRKDIESSLRSLNPNLAEHYFVGCDTEGAIASAFPKGGVVLIAGTGSNCELVNPNGERFRVGGWGHLLGDEGSGSWISLKAIKTVFDTMDNMDPSPHDVTFVRSAMYKYFEISDQMGMLSHMYGNFSKTKIAGFCLEIAKGASEQKDPLCLHLFHEAGKVLGRHVLAILPKVDKSLLEAEGGFNILCVGSIFNSWNVMKQGFLEGLAPRFSGEQTVKEFTLHKLVTDGSYGAAYLGAKAGGLTITTDYSKNTNVFCHHKFS